MKSDTLAESEIQVSSDAKLGVSMRLTRWLHPLTVTIGVLVFVVAIYVLHKELSNVSFHQIAVQLGIMQGYQVGLAFLCMLLSYFALTNYDRLALKYVGRKLPARKVGAIAFTAFAVGHNVGVSAVSAGSIRYRAYSLLGLSALEIASIIAFCSFTFAVGGGLLFATTLLLEPSTTVASLGVSDVILKIVAITIFLLLGFYLFAVVFLKGGFVVRGVKIPMPSLSISLQQVVFASIDLLAAAATLYFLLPGDAGISYPIFLSAFLLAIFLGLISSIPAGVGVFEGVMLVLLPSLPSEELLGSIIAYRIIYYILPLIAAISILTQQEISAHREKLSSMVKRGGGWASGMAPQVIGIVVFIAGIILLVSGSLPGNASRLYILPLSLLETSHMLNSAIGVALLIVAHGLYQRLRGAFQLALVLLIAGIVFSLGKGLDIEESISLLFIAVMLWVCREEFYRPAALIDLRFSKGWIFSVLLVLAGTLWIGLFVYKHIEYRDAMWWQFATDANAPRMLRAMLTATLVAAAFGIFRLTRAAPPKSEEASEDDLEKAKSIVSRSECSSSNIALLGDKRFLFHPDGDAFIMYQISGNSWISLGNPVGNPEHFEQLVWQFRELSHRNGDMCAFYQVDEKHLPLYVDLGLSLSKLGEEATVSLRDFSLEGSHRAELRQARNKGLRNGVIFEIISKESLVHVLEELKQVSDEWLKDKSVAEKGFSLGNFDPEYLLNFDCAVAKVEGKIVAFANLWPSANKCELSIDLMRYNSQAPKGIMDYLFVEILLWGQSQQYQQFSLGMAPLSGLEKHPLATFWHKAGNSIFRLGDNFYNFEGLRSYKGKFDPKWESLYLAAPGGLALPRVLVDITVLISGGLRKVFFK